MNANTKNNTKGGWFGFELLGGTEAGERKYHKNSKISKEANERIGAWNKKQKAKLGKVTLFTFGKA